MILRGRFISFTCSHADFRARNMYKYICTNQNLFSIMTHVYLLFLQMNIVVATSRGAGLQGRINDPNTKVHVYPGGKLRDMTESTLKSITSTGSYSSTKHIYFIAGIPDITKRIREYKNYQEIIYTEKPEETFTRIKNEITHTNNKILEAGAIPIFCTIAPTKIKKYNEHRLRTRNTNSLYHQENYSKMQKNLEATLDLINNEITYINTSNNMSTPYLHTIIKKGTGPKEAPKYTFYYNKLYDGVHATDKTKDSWATSIKQAIKKNRVPDEEEDEEPKSPKRSWRSERFRE